MNTKTLLYNEIFKKAKTVKANCIASIKEKLINDEVIITVSFYKKMTEHKPLFVDLDGTLIKEDLSNLAFQNSLRTNPLLTVVYLIIFYFEVKRT